MSESAGEKRRYVAFTRDHWGFARRVGNPKEMSAEEALRESQLRRQLQMGWLVLESEAENER